MTKIRAAIYARFSSENQRPESIEDQVFMCRKAANERAFVVLDEHVYTDEAESGASWTRPGLDRLCESARNHRFDVVVIDDLSRLARDSYLMTRLLLDFQYEGIRVVSVADGVDTADPHSKLLAQLHGIFNEQYLQGLRDKTMRGLIGQKQRGFILAEAGFGYRSYSVGAVRYDKAGRARPEGHKARIDPDEAAVVLRIFEEYAAGESVSGIVRQLNREAVPGRYRSSKGWSTGSVTRILDQEKFIGVWTWNKGGKRRDPRTGRQCSYEKPESEWIVFHDESLRIVPQALWERVRARRATARGVWPGGKGRRGFSKDQGGRVRIFRSTSCPVRCSAASAGVASSSSAARATATMDVPLAVMKAVTIGSRSLDFLPRRSSSTRFSSVLPTLPRFNTSSSGCRRRLPGSTRTFRRPFAARRLSWATSVGAGTTSSTSSRKVSKAPPSASAWRRPSRRCRRSRSRSRS